MTATLAERVEQATGPDRELDRAVGFAIGLGVEKERKLYIEMGPAMWVPTPELRGLTPYDRARGSAIRSEWVKGSRGRKGHYQDVRWGACDGPSPLTNSPLFTGSIDAAMTLVPEGWVLGEFSWWPHAKSSTVHMDNMHGLKACSGACHPALALCAAALRAIEGTRNERD